MAKRLIATLTPDTQTATYQYTGVGVGKVDFVAEVDIEDDTGETTTAVSQPIEITDCMWYDKGINTDYNPNWREEYNRVTITRSSNGTNVTNTSDNYTFMTANKQGTGSTDADFDTPLCIEFDMIVNDTTNVGKIQIYQADDLNKYFDKYLETGHWKININKNNVTWSVNGVNKDPVNNAIGKCFIRLRVPVGTNFTFHDFKIYLI